MEPETMKQRWFQKHPRLAILITVITASFLLPSIFELTLYLFLCFPSLNNYFPYFKSTVISVYYTADRNILQFMPACTKYDPELTYILRPGEFRFGNREYCNRYSVNSIGLRDDEESLSSPQIIVLGDSYALGWGVEQNETFAQLLEKQTGMKTLNAGVASYATAREMMLLKRIDTSELKYLMLQYSDNDLEENQSFASNNFMLEITSREKYEAECQRHVSRKRYAPFLFTSAFLRIHVVQYLFEEPVSQLSPVPVYASSQTEASRTISKSNGISSAEGTSFAAESNHSAEAAELFLKILSRKNFSGIKIIVLNLSHFSVDTRSFIHHLSARKDSGAYPLFIKNMRLIDASSFLEKGDYYIIDDHLKASGHQKVAQAIIRELKRLKGPESGG